jgi:ribosomal protein S26
VSVLSLRASTCEQQRTDHGHPSHVIVEAVGSRCPSDKALARMRYHDADIVSHKMVVFEWLRQAGTETFRQVSREFI